MNSDPLFYINKLSEFNKNLNSLSAILRVESYGREGAKKGKALLTVSREPQWIFVEAKSPTDDLISFFGAETERFIYYERGAENCYTGLPCRKNLKKMTQFDLDLDTLISLFLWNSPLIKYSKAGVEFDARKGFIVLTLSNEAESEEIFFTPAGIVPSGLKYRGKNGAEYTLTGSDLKEFENGIVIPLVINYRSAADGSDVTIKFRDMILNEDLSNFSIAECPEGVGVRVLPCED